MGKHIVPALLVVLCGSAAGIVHGQEPSPPADETAPVLREDPSWRSRFDKDEPEFGHSIFCQFLVGS